MRADDRLVSVRHGRRSRRSSPGTSPRGRFPLEVHTMRASRALAVTATAFAAVGLAAPMAVATNGPVNVAVNPQAVHQGGTLKVTAQGCGHGGKVWSNAFPTTTLSPGDGTNYAHARVRNNTTPGQYHLSVKCSDNDRIATHKFTVLMRQRCAGRARRHDGPELRGDAGRRRSGGRCGRRRRGLPRPASADEPCGVLRRRTSRPARYARRPESWIRTRGDCRVPHARGQWRRSAERRRAK